MAPCRVCVRMVCTRSHRLQGSSHTPHTQPAYAPSRASGGPASGMSLIIMHTYNQLLGAVVISGRCVLARNTWRAGRAAGLKPEVAHRDSSRSTPKQVLQWSPSSSYRDTRQLGGSEWPAACVPTTQPRLTCGLPLESCWPLAQRHLHPRPGDECTAQCTEDMT